MARRANVLANLEPINTAEMERAAKARGYRSYAHMIASMRARQPPPRLPGSGPQTGGAGNFFRNLWNDPGATLSDAFSWHPKNTIKRASGALRSARER